MREKKNEISQTNHLCNIYRAVCFTYNLCIVLQQQQQELEEYDKGRIIIIFMKYSNFDKSIDCYQQVHYNQV